MQQDTNAHFDILSLDILTRFPLMKGKLVTVCPMMLKKQIFVGAERHTVTLRRSVVVHKATHWHIILFQKQSNQPKGSSVEKTRSVVHINPVIPHKRHSDALCCYEGKLAHIHWLTLSSVFTEPHIIHCPGR